MEAAARIHAVFPALRAIAVLRNPRERTVSAFNDYVRMGIIRYEGAHRARTPAERAEVMASLIDEKVRLSSFFSSSSSPLECTGVQRACYRRSEAFADHMT